MKCKPGFELSLLSLFPMIITIILHVPLYKPAHWPCEQSVRQWSRRPGFNPMSRHTKDFKNGIWYTQQYKVHIKGKVEQSREKSSPALHLGVVAIEKGAFRSPSTKVANFTYYLYIYIYIYIYIHIYVMVVILAFRLFEQSK